MISHVKSLTFLAAVSIALSLPAPRTARAERKNPLADAPAVRHRLLLLPKRFELAPAFEATVNADYMHTVSGGLKLEYHFSDMWSFGVVGFYGKSIRTGLVNRILDTLPDTSTAGDPTPTRLQYQDHLNKMPMHGGAYATWTPWYGKLAAFGKAFVNFDFYFSGGLSYASLTNDCSNSVCTDQHPGGDPDANPVIPPDDNPNNDPPLNDGTRLGLYLGGGIHVFINDFIALDLTVRDYMFSDNPSGLDFTADLAVTDDDPRFMTHLFAGIGISIMLPTAAKRTK